MQVHIFRGPGRIFGVTTDIEGNTLPSHYGLWASFKSLDITRGEPTPGVNVDDCLHDIAMYGFHLTDAHVRITEQAIK
jgi:hypothetical protein